MIVLGIETSGARLSVALAGPEGPVADHVAPDDRRHTEQLAPAVEDLCRRSGIRPVDLGAVVVDIGPGLFTGLRVGIATAAALAAALEIPAVGITSTDVLAEPHHRPDRSVVAVVDVRRGELAWARYGPGGGAPEVGPALVSTAGLSAVLAESQMSAGLAAAGLPGAGLAARGLLVVGDTAGALAGVGALAALPDVVVDPVSVHPSARVLAGLGRRRLRAGTAVVGDLTPCYLRQPDVRIGWATAGTPA